MGFEHLLFADTAYLREILNGVNKKTGRPIEFPFTLQNCVLTRLDFSKNSFRIEGNDAGTGRELRGIVNERD